jgi:hypothetical protein
MVPGEDEGQERRQGLVHMGPDPSQVLLTSLYMTRAYLAQAWHDLSELVVPLVAH